MRRADRLFQLVQLLRRRSTVTARQLAEALEVSERTVYRDIRDLTLAGVPVQGEAGVGYRMDRDYDLPPLMFTEDEIEALVLGARMVRAWADPVLVKGAEDALAKIEAVLPSRLQRRIEQSTLFSVNLGRSDAVSDNLALLRLATRERLKVRLSYSRADSAQSERTVRPLCLAFFAPQWLLTVWCELRDDFRNLRLDRISHLTLLDETFVPEPGRNLRDYLRAVHEER